MNPKIYVQFVKKITNELIMDINVNIYLKLIIVFLLENMNVLNVLQIMFLIKTYILIQYLIITKIYNK